MKRKTIKLMTTTLLLSTMLSFSSLAAWEQSEAGWKYKDDTTNVYLSNGWHWLDGNKDGISECYYLDSTGIMSANSIVDNYTINADGQWTVDNVVETRVVGSGSQTSGTGNQSNAGGSLFDRAKEAGKNQLGDNPIPIDGDYAENIANATYY